MTAPREVNPAQHLESMEVHGRDGNIALYCNTHQEVIALWAYTSPPTIMNISSQAQRHLDGYSPPEPL